MADRPRTIGELRETGYRPRSVKEELRANLIESLAKKKGLFPGIVGYEATVVPQIENAILSGQDIILLGERGQAKTRIARQLVELLDQLARDARLRLAALAEQDDVLAGQDGVLDLRDDRGLVADDARE